MKLTPLLPRGQPTVRISTRVRPETHAALLPEPGRRLREIAEAWARRQR